MNVGLRVRGATEEDLEDLLRLAQQRREQYRSYQPQFWRPAQDAVQRQRGFFESLLADDQVVLLVAELGSEFRGFVIARAVSAPPVYSPGGLTCVVDDFTVVEPADWRTVGPALLEAARTWGADNGAAQLVVVTAHLDQPKRAALGAAQMTLASEWWSGRSSRTREAVTQRRGLGEVVRSPRAAHPAERHRIASGSQHSSTKPPGAT